MLCSCTPVRLGVAACPCCTEGLAQEAFVTCFSDAPQSVGERPRHIQEKQRGKKRRAFHSREEQTVGIVTNSLLPLCHRALTTFSMLFEHLLNEPVSAFILTPYLRVQSSAELQKCNGGAAEEAAPGGNC